MKIDLSAIRKILIIQLRAIGDVILTTPVIAVLKKHMPAAEIHFLTISAIAPLLQGMQNLERVIPYPYPPNSFFGLKKMSALVKKEKYDLIIDYQVSPGTAKITADSGAAYRLAWKIHRNQSAYNLFSEANRLALYVPVQKCMALQEIGIDEINTKTRVSFSADAAGEVATFLQKCGCNKNSLKINITPCGKRQAREWEFSKIRELTKILTDQFNAFVFYNALPGERERVAALLPENCQNLHILPRWSLEKFAAYMAEVDLHISYDNGPKHLAIAAGTPTIAMFATDPPELWNPEDDLNHPAILTNAACRFCGLRYCDLKICMKDIQPETIIENMLKIPKLKMKLNHASEPS